jgi:hypothetical protein
MVEPVQLEEDWKELTDGKEVYYYDNNHPLGKGVYGTVYLGYDANRNLEKVALKFIQLKNLREKSEELLAREIKIA